jgi:DNA-binding MarR family transcriptional regulator
VTAKDIMKRLTDYEGSAMNMKCVVSRLDKLIAQRLESEFGLTFNQLIVLMNVDMDPDVTQKDLATQTNLTEAAISRQVDALIIDGIIMRLTNQTDRRKHILKFTEKGKMLFANLEKNRNQDLAKFFEKLNAEEIKTLRIITNKLTNF